MSDSLANTNGRVREWIGPRIVPVFADEVQWNINSTYEPLIMVQSQGETFMSRQYVPAGIELPNTSGDEESNDYWVHMSNWNAQVEYYRQEVLAFDNRIDALEDSLPIADFDSTHTIDGRFDTIEANGWVTSDRIADGSVGTAELANGSVTSQKMASGSVDSSAIIDGTIQYGDLNISVKNQMRNRNFICLGDSYGKGLYPTADGYVRSNYGWMIALKNLIDTHYDTCTIKTNLDTYSTVAGVTGFTTSDDFLGILQNIASTVINKEEITDIVVMAGENDRTAASQATIESAINEFMEYALNTFPNAHIKIGVLAVGINNLSNVKRAYRTSVQKYGGLFIDDVFHLFTIKANVASDGIHLTNDGYYNTYPYLMSAAITGHCSYYFKNNVTLTNAALPSNYEWDGSPRISYEVTPKMITLQLRTEGISGLLGIKDNANNLSEKTINITFDHPIVLPEYYDIITNNIMHKYDESRAVSGNVLQLITASRGCMYTTPTGASVFLAAQNAYEQQSSVRWVMESFKFVYPSLP